MIFQIIEENGVKKIQALTADTGAGAPVGSFIYMYKKSSHSGYLYCDGSTFDATKYPLLYAYLGSNVLPDYRECVEVGAEQNTTDTIATHDVYTEGQFKDDQIQSHGHEIRANDSGGNNVMALKGTSAEGSARGSVLDTINARVGSTTHGKQKAVFIYIKATSGLTENQQENVLNTINENLSYSTTEHKTGKKWIDGKDIWEITIPCTTQQDFATGAWVDITRGFVGISSIIANIDTLVETEIRRTKALIDNNSNVLINHPQQNAISIFPTVAGNISTSGSITLEYTKTTDN